MLCIQNSTETEQSKNKEKLHKQKSGLEKKKKAVYLTAVCWETILTEKKKEQINKQANKNIRKQ